MGKTIQVNGEAQEHDPGKKVGELKKELGISDGERLTVTLNGENMVLSDKDRVEHIPDGASVGRVIEEGMGTG